MLFRVIQMWTLLLKPHLWVHCAWGRANGTLLKHIKCPVVFSFFLSRRMEICPKLFVSKNAARFCPHCKPHVPKRTAASGFSSRILGLYLPSTLHFREIWPQTRGGGNECFWRFWGFQNYTGIWVPVGHFGHRCRLTAGPLTTLVGQITPCSLPPTRPFGPGSMPRRSET